MTATRDAMDSFQHDGVWWDPTQPNEQWVGTLRFDKRDGASLTVTFPSERADFFPSMKRYDLILGLTTNGTAITLFNCFDRFTRGTLAKVPRRIEIFVNSLIVGFHCNSRDPLVSTASVAFQHLTEWWGHSGIEQDFTVTAPDLAVRYTSPAPLVVHDDGLWRVSLRPTAASSSGRHRITLHEEVRFELKASTPQPLSECRRRVQDCEDFLSIACFTLCAIDTLVLVPSRAPDAPTQLGTFHAMPIYKSRDRGSAVEHTLLRSSDIAARVPEILSAWFSQAETLYDVRALYLAGVYGGGFLETKLLALTQAAEAFHRRFYPDVYMDPSAFVTDVFEPMKAAIPKSVAKSHRAAISTRLQFANEFSQSRRLKALFHEHVETLRVLIDQPETWVKPILDHRNAFTHFDPAGKVARGPDQVLLYNFLLRLLLEACFLKAMGLTVDEITRLAHRSEGYRQIAQQFFGKGSSGPGGAGKTP